ncbi:MAG: hypothetical protein Altm2KO_11240 [Alteromonas macleodii]|jgi:hypothetical protein|uniref:hypothetical protein n=1 Tax=Alteromonas sp. MmMcT2-2 TaxID=2917732 RepID=UPI001EF16E49|nr:hypothetical protein [Alteromonas sp. MmMcT2-2]MCG7640614.1 hypothetical protein [Alteromonas sp. MmMcT2-2]
MKLSRMCCFIMASTALFSCSTIHKGPENHIFSVNAVPAFDIGTIDKLDSNKFEVKYTIDDQKVFRYVQYLKDTLRKKVKQGRVGEESFSTFQVVTAALASAFSASTGVHPDVVTSLAGLSALSPDIADIISAGEKAKAYAQTLEMIESADAAYIQARAQATSSSNALIPSSTLTPQGAVLFVSTVASLKVMRDALLGTIPKVEDLEKAMGKYAQFAMAESEIEVEVPKANLAANKSINANKTLYSREIILYKGDEIAKCSSSTPAVLTVTCTSANKDSITLQAESVGNAKVTVLSNSGELTTVDVTVKEI